VRRYPPFCTASTAYELHPAGLAVLARYASGRNVASAPINCTLPLLLKLPAGGEGGGVYLSPGDVATAGAATGIWLPRDAVEAELAAPSAARPKAMAAVLGGDASPLGAMAGTAYAPPSGGWAAATPDATSGGGPAAGDTGSLVDDPSCFPPPLPLDGITIAKFPSFVVAVAPVDGDWAEERAVERAAELAALAARDGLGVADEPPLLAQHRLGMAGERPNEVWVVLSDHPFDVEPLDELIEPPEPQPEPAEDPFYEDIFRVY